MNDPGTEKKKPLKKLFKITGKIVKGIAGGVLDTCLPNIHKTITMQEPDLPKENKKVNIDWPRLITSITIWILLVLVFFGKIKFSDVVSLIDKLLI